jgi:hypothetical protein
MARLLSLRGVLANEIYLSSSGNMLQLLCADSYGDYEFRWQQQYGAVYRVKGCFGVSSSGLSPVTLYSLQWHRKIALSFQTPKRYEILSTTLRSAILPLAGRLGM